MTFEEYMGVDTASVEWQEAKQRLEHLDACPLCEKSANFSV
jgi:hypothetical protein